MKYYVVFFLFLLSFVELNAAELNGKNKIKLTTSRLVGGQDFNFRVIQSPFSSPSLYGYSVSCPKNMKNKKNKIGLLFSAYGSEEDAGSVHLIPADQLGRFSSLSENSIKTIRGEPPRLSWYDKFKNIVKRVLGKEERRALGWFGHEVDLGDVNGDGYLDALIGARFYNEGRGAAYFISGTTLTDLLRGNTANYSVAELMSDGRATRFSPKNTDKKEFGWAVAILRPKEDGSNGSLIIRSSTGVAGSAQAGSVALIPYKENWPEEVQVSDDLFSGGAGVLGEDFGRTLVSLQGHRKLGELLIGSYANPKHFGAAYVSGKVWAGKIQNHRLRVSPLFDTHEVFQDEVARHLMPAALDLGGSEAVAIGLNPAWQSTEIEAGLYIMEHSSSRHLYMYHPDLNGVQFAWSLLSLDVNGDGFDDLVVGANGYKTADASWGQGALVIVSGKEISENLSGKKGPVSAKILSFPDSRITGVGSKRRQCGFIKEDGRASLVFGAPYNKGSIIFIDVPKNIFEM